MVKFTHFKSIVIRPLHTARATFLLTWLLAFAFLFIQASTSNARAASSTQTGSTIAEVLCLPGVYTLAPQDCLLSGPAVYIPRMAGQGIPSPLPPLPVHPPAVELSYNLYQ